MNLETTLDDAISTIAVFVKDGGASEFQLAHLAEDLEDARSSMEFDANDYIGMQSEIDLLRGENDTLRDAIGKVKDHFNLGWDVRVVDVPARIAALVPPVETV